jgi:predicted nucleic acid-binding protein
VGGTGALTVDDALSGVTRLCIDAAPLIYLIEDNPEFAERVQLFVERIDAGYIQGFTASLTLTEVLVHPIRLGDVILEEEYQQILERGSNFTLVPIDATVARCGAALRARYNLRTPDAIQIAVGIETGCEAFLTNDLKLERVDDLRIITLQSIDLP